MIDSTSNFKIDTIDSSSKEQELKDFGILQKILNEEISIAELDDFTRRRIIKICNNRLEVMKARVESRKKGTERLEELLHKAEKL